MMLVSRSSLEWAFSSPPTGTSDQSWNFSTTRCFNTASWIYYGRREEGGRILSPEGNRVEVPTGCAVFPREMLRWPPRSYAERIYNVTHWTEMPRGGHFAAMEEPEMLVTDIRTFARSLRR